MATEQDITLSRALRKALGHEDEPGSCRDCGGMGVVPSAKLTRLHGHGERGVWEDCPSCHGLRRGGVA